MATGGAAMTRGDAMQCLVTTLQTTTYTAAQSATVWAMNALVQGQKATLGLLLQPDTISTLMRCITADNGAAPGTVRLLLVVFLHSGKHEELRAQLLAEPEVSPHAAYACIALAQLLLGRLLRGVCR
jgi:hypothetical protein